MKIKNYIKNEIKNKKTTFKYKTKIFKNKQKKILEIQKTTFGECGNLHNHPAHTKSNSLTLPPTTPTTDPQRSDGHPFRGRA
jgi:hypothetical protein